MSEVAYRVGMSPKQFAKFFKEEYGVLVNDRIDDKFASQYNVMSTLISNTLAKIMDYEVNEAIKD